MQEWKKEKVTFENYRESKNDTCKTKKIKSDTWKNKIDSLEIDLKDGAFTTMSERMFLVLQKCIELKRKIWMWKWTLD